MLFKNISHTLIVMVIAMLSSFIVTLLLGRSLSPSAFGEFTLLRQILLIGATVSVFGLDLSFIKLYAGEVRPPKFIHHVALAFIVIIGMTYAIIAALVYDIVGSRLYLLIGSVILSGITLYLAALLRVKGNYFLAQLFAAGWKILLLLGVGAVLLLGDSIDIDTIYQLIFFSLLIFGLYIFRYSLGEDNQDPVPKKYLSYGILFWVINSTGLISGGIDKLVIPLSFGKDILGIYAAISFVFITSFTMVGSAVGYVLFPKISAGNRIQFSTLALWLGALIAAMGFIFQVFGLSMVSMIFSGFYDEHITRVLILCFTIIGTLQIVHTIIHFVISAKADKKHLIYYWGLTVFIIFVFIGLTFLWEFTEVPVILYLALIVIVTKLMKITLMLGLTKRIYALPIKSVELEPNELE